MSLIDVEGLQEIAENEFGDIVTNVDTDLNRLRVYLRDASFLDVWYSIENEGRYSYHWERRHIDGTLYRHNNAPHKKWSHVVTFPKHFHAGSEEQVESSGLNSEPTEAMREMLSFARRTIL
ncbi:MAG: hypothetical protein HDKAJFGB_03634 [Anaerolineae bacterium]|nr:hypothetical protein [Anaerolineae bacterium]RIK30114.1 MAG: hypothetical protein DCC52_06590 [Chloroflexota bacterium]